VQIGGEWYYATFFYESVWCFLIAALLLVWEKKGRFRCQGDAFWTYLFLYALERSIIEGMRTDSLYIGPLRVSQMLSLAAMCAAAVILILNRKKDSGKTDKRKNRGE
jgi:phosphatidylglycerol:prolipoprotein diacylglycerol transferase